MNKATERAYHAWLRAANRGYGNFDNPWRNSTPSDMKRVDDRIRALRAKYEALLARELLAKKG